MRTLPPLLAALVTAVALDALTKAWAEGVLVAGRPAEIIGEFFSFTLGYNTGVAFGLFANGGTGPLVVTGLIIAALVAWLAYSVRGDGLPRAGALAVGLILGGAIANFADRLPDGRVTDFLDVGYGAIRWPTFNLADSFIVLGVVVLLWSTPPGRQAERGHP